MGQTAPSRPGVPAASELARRKFLSPAEAQAALARLRELALQPGGSEAELDRLASGLRESGYVAEMTALIAEALEQPSAHPHLGVLWMRRHVSSKSWDRSYPSAVDALCQRGEIGRGAVLELLRYAGERRKVHLVREVWRRHRRWLKEHPKGWPLMGWALVNNADYRRALAWLEGWEVRAPGDLRVQACVAHALRGLGREAKADAMVRATLEQANPSEVRHHYPQLLMWAAVEAALAGDVESAATWLGQVEPAGWDDQQTNLYYLARGVLRVKQTDADRRRQAFRHAYDRIRERFRRVPPYQHDRMTRRLYRRCVWRMALDAGYYRRAALSCWRAADSAAPLWALCLIPGLQPLVPVYLLRWLRNPPPGRR